MARRKRNSTYPFEEFWAHLLELSSAWDLEKSALRSRSKGSRPVLSFNENLTRIAEYMLLHCKEEDYLYRSTMFATIFTYLVEHAHEYDEGKYAVLGSSESEALVSKYLLMAIHHWYTSRSERRYSKGPRAAEIKVLADEFEKQSNSACS